MNFKKYRDIAVVILALAVPFWFLRASMRDPKTVTGPDRLIVTIATPIQHFAAMLARGISSIWGDYIYLVDVKQTNDRLASQVARLTEEKHQLENNLQDLRRCQRLVGLKTNIKAETISAQVIGKNTNDFFRVIRVTLDRESRDIGPNLPVLSPDGVVGTTVKSAGDTVDVRLVVDAGSGVDVVVERTGARGFVRGTGDDSKYLCNVEYFQRTDEVEVGDQLVTSGVGRRFPRGIPVGTVTQVERRDFGMYQKVLAAPAVDFSRLEEVLIVTSPPADEPAQASRNSPGSAPAPRN